MYVKNNANQLNNCINIAHVGKKIYVNAMTLTSDAVERLREVIQLGQLKVDEVELQAAIVEEACQEYRLGKRILPQAHYIKMW